MILQRPQVYYDFQKYLYIYISYWNIFYPFLMAYKKSIFKYNFTNFRHHCAKFLPGSQIINDSSSHKLHLDRFGSLRTNYCIAEILASHYKLEKHDPYKGPSLYYVTIFSDFFWPTHPPTHPLCQHKYSTECQQKLPFSEPIHPVLLLT